MKTLKKSSGFFIVEILIVLAIIGILVLALIPAYTSYIQRAKFMDVVLAAEALKADVASCLVKLGTTAATTAGAAGCSSGFNGVPPNPASYGGNVASVDVNRTLIKVTSTSTFGPAGDAPYDYVLHPSLQAASGAVTWAVDDPASTCLAVGLCSK